MTSSDMAFSEAVRSQERGCRRRYLERSARMRAARHGREEAHGAGRVRARLRHCGCAGSGEENQTHGEDQTREPADPNALACQAKAAPRDPAQAPPGAGPGHQFTRWPAVTCQAAMHALGLRPRERARRSGRLPVPPTPLPEGVRECTRVSKQTRLRRSQDRSCLHRAASRPNRQMLGGQLGHARTSASADH